MRKRVVFLYMSFSIVSVQLRVVWSTIYVVAPVQLHSKQSSKCIHMCEEPINHTLACTYCISFVKWAVPSRTYEFFHQDWDSLKH